MLLYFGLLLLVVLLYGLHRFTLDKLYRLPPGPTPFPFLGNALFFRTCKKNWIIFDRLSKIYGPVFRFYIGHCRLIVLSRAEEIQNVIVAQSSMSSDRPASIMPGLENMSLGVIQSSGKTWQSRRRFALKALRDFGMGKMALVEKIQGETHFLLSEFENCVSQPIEPKHLLSNAVSNVICSLVFGKRFEYDDPSFEMLMEYIYKMATIPVSRQFIFFILPFVRFFSSPLTISLLSKMQNRVANMLREAIKERRQDFDPENIRDFPDIFIQAGICANNKNADEVLDFDTFALVMNDLFLAGTETTSTLLGWTLLYLCKFPEVQERCQQAIDSVIESNRLPVPADRPRLVYVDAVMCESLRYSSMVPLSVFHAVLDGKLAINGYDIPPNSIIGYNVWSVHHDLLYWKDPEVFNPDRWIDADGNLLSHSTHFLPFGTGPRICLGESMARMEFFIFAVSLLQRFSFSLADSNVSIEDGKPGLIYCPPSYELIVSKR